MRFFCHCSGTGEQNYISGEDLTRTLKLLGEDLSDEEVLHMVQASTGHPGENDAPRISYEDFMKLVPPLCPSHLFEARLGDGRGGGGIGGDSEKSVFRACAATVE